MEIVIIVHSDIIQDHHLKNDDTCMILLVLLRKAERVMFKDLKSIVGNTIYETNGNNGKVLDTNVKYDETSLSQLKALLAEAKKNIKVAAKSAVAIIRKFIDTFSFSLKLFGKVILTVDRKGIHIQKTLISKLLSKLIKSIVVKLTDLLLDRLFGM